MRVRKSSITRWLLMGLVVLMLIGCSQESLTGLGRGQGMATPVSGPAERPPQATPQLAPPVAPSPSDVAKAATRTPGPRATRPAPTDTPQAAPGPGEGEEAVLVGAGDIGDCDGEGDERTADLLDGIEGTVFTLGDNVYDEGTTREFRDCYDDNWGRHKERTRPAPGNHDYRTEDAGPYFDYFGDAAGEKGKGYYSYDLGSWHIVVLNSNCKHVGGCEEDSAQMRWLEDDLDNNPARCTLAYWHHPLYNAGKHGNEEAVRPLWGALYEAGAEVVLAGHDHNYQRFAPQDPNAESDPERGIRQFIVGTGGKDHYEIENRLPNLEVSNDDTNGVLKLTLHADGYSWEFIPVEGEDFRDSGTDSCH